MKNMTITALLVVGLYVSGVVGANAASVSSPTLRAQSSEGSAVSASCALDAVEAGAVCLDRYESGVWLVPEPTTTNVILVDKIRLGTATLFDLTAGGARQLGMEVDDYAPCADGGGSCADDIYAVSLPSETPSSHITWFQAQEACANSGKRLPTSAEWQLGANGTPDSGPDNRTTDCNSASNIVTVAGSRTACVSARGAFDMVGNLEEWVADWMPLSTECPGWGGLSNDRMCLAGASTAVGGPGALTRGGSFVDGPGAGPLAVVGGRRPTVTFGFIGFRCARSTPVLLPEEVDESVRISRNGSNAVLTWSLAAGASTSQVLRGHVRELPVGSAGADERCLVVDTELNTLTDTELPATGDSFWYLVRGANVSGSGPYGFEGLHGVAAAPRTSTTCP